VTNVAAAFAKNISPQR